MRNVLALSMDFCGRVALDQAGVDYDTYYSSEIDPKCVEVVTHQHPTTVHLETSKWKSWDIDDIDLVMGGSPCQGFSFRASNSTSTIHEANCSGPWLTSSTISSPSISCSRTSS